MRRPGQYGGPGGNAYVSAQMQHISGQRIEQKSNSYQGRPESMTSEKEHPYGTSRADGQWGWERDGSSHIFNEGKFYLPYSYSLLFFIYLSTKYLFIS